MLKKIHNKKIIKEEKKGNVNKINQLTKELNENIKIFQNILQNDNTIIFREIENMKFNNFKSCLIYIDEMIDVEISNRNIIYPIMNADLKIDETNHDILNQLKNKVISANNIKITEKIDELLQALFSGDAILLVNDAYQALVIDCKGWQARSIEEPDFEKSLRGPREGFTESIMTNLSLIRRRLKTPDLKFKFKEIGVRSRTKICISYIDTLASDKVIKELEDRLNKIDIDGVLDSGYIQELIKDSPLSPFETIGSTERPDVAAAKLLEGRIAVVVDGSPAVLTLPFVFMEYFQVAEDYYVNFNFASINRILRTVGEFFTSSIPAIYVALTTFHQEMIPTHLLLSISAARQGVPFPTIIEALALLFAFETIREAGARMPLPMGQSVSIVGALILGQASIEARIFSAPMVIVIAAAGITGLLTIKLKGASIFIRVTLLLASGVMGLYGYIFAVSGFLIYLFSMRSFGLPYMLEYGSINPVDIKDTVIRAPWWSMVYRPKHTAAKNIIRQSVSKMEGNNGE